MRWNPTMPTTHKIRYADLLAAGLANTITRLRRPDPPTTGTAAETTTDTTTDTTTGTTTGTTENRALADCEDDGLTVRCAVCGRRAADRGGYIIADNESDLLWILDLIGWTCAADGWHCRRCTARGSR